MSGKEQQPGKQKFLVMYDYGMGGLWAYLWARDKNEIQQLFPELKIVDEWPPSMSEATQKATEERETYDIDSDQERGILKVVMAERGSP